MQDPLVPWFTESLVEEHSFYLSDRSYRNIIPIILIKVISWKIFEIPNKHQWLTSYSKKVQKWSLQLYKRFWKIFRTDISWILAANYSHYYVMSWSFLSVTSVFNLYLYRWRHWEITSDHTFVKWHFIKTNYFFQFLVKALATFFWIGILRSILAFYIEVYPWGKFVHWLFLVFSK